MENKAEQVRQLEDKFYDLEKILDDILLTTYQRLNLLKDNELLKESDYLIEAGKNIKSFGKAYRELLDYDVAEPPVYGKIVSRLESLRKLLKKELRLRAFKGSDRTIRKDDDFLEDIL